VEIVTLPEVHVSQAETSAIENLVGNTPLLPLRRITAHLPDEVQIYAKAEWFNPGGSVKDRPALNIIRSALADGSLGAGKRLLDSTSGNMGISYATFCAALGVPVTLALPANASPERQAILRALSAELVLTDPLEGSDGALEVARRMAKKNPEHYFYANQYDNPANWQAHYYSTGPEVVRQTDCKITHFVAGMGTSGTIIGAGRYLRQYNPEIEIIAVQPEAAFHGLEGLKHIETAIRPGIYDPHLADETMAVTTESAHEMTRALARKEGLFVGVSAGAAAVAALRLAERLVQERLANEPFEEAVIVTVFPDAGYKYLSDKALWEA
jgi:cysteine synthase B